MDDHPKASTVYAHSLKDAPTEYWQTMRDHALAVAELAAERGTKFEASELARVAGLLHDVTCHPASWSARA